MQRVEIQERLTSGGNLMNDKKDSRKYKAFLLILLVAACALILPPIASLILTLIFGKALSISILTGTEFTTLIPLIYGMYVSGNVYQAKVLNQKEPPKE